MQNKPKYPYAQIGKILRQIRESYYHHQSNRSGVSLEDFGSDILAPSVNNHPYSKGAISRWENGEIRPDRVVLRGYRELSLGQHEALDYKHDPSKSPPLEEGELQRLYDQHDQLGPVQGGPKPEDIPVVEDLTLEDTVHALYRLRNVLYVQGFKPVTVILGINRGGAIVGGWLGKLMGVPMTQIPCGAWELGSEESPIAPALRDRLARARHERVLLVDDCYRTGKTMNSALDCLGDCLDHVEVKKAVLLNEIHRKRDSHPDFYVYTTETDGIGLPWEVRNQHN